MDDITTVRETLKALAPGKFTRLCKIVPSGTLEVRLSKNTAVTFYWRGAVGHRTVRVPIGVFDSKAPPKALSRTANGFSVQAAIRTAENIAQQHQQSKHQGGYLAAQKALREQLRQEQQAQITSDEQTLAKLLYAYCDHLEAIGRAGHKDARSIFNLHIVSAFPQIAAKPAAEVSPEEIADMMRRLMEIGKGRTANKLRSYARAAYATAKRARLDPKIPVAFKAFRITTNPAAETVPDTTQNRSAKNPLDKTELVTYWKAIRRMPGQDGAILRLHLLTGGQRIAQLIALRSKDVTRDTITLHDSKGRPGAAPRAHLLPLTPPARRALDEANPQGEYALSTDGGTTHVHAATVLRWAQAAVKDEIPGFTAKRIRSGVETLLSQLGISKEVRGRIQSHGITGVQDRHYDAHDYLPEKKRALMMLYEALEQSPAAAHLPPQGAITPQPQKN